MTGKIVAVCISKAKGTAKIPIEEAIFLENQGIQGDGHSGTIRQVSLLMKESVDRFNSAHEVKAEPGEFAENLLLEGLDLTPTKLGDKFQIGEVILEASEIGKELNPNHYSFHGYRLLPTEGVFCKVAKGGKVSPGDEIKAI
jgi:MOSC domain-containing protein YiiM